MKEKTFIIAIDGYSSCGKSTLAKTLAVKLGFTFIDTGAMYRAVTLYFLKNEVDFEDKEALERALAEIDIHIQNKNGENRLFLNGKDVSADIRQMYVSDRVSEVSALKEVREAMVRQQRELGERTNIVMDGRDIGTVVFPHADLKIFMTASPEVRTQRRYEELLQKGEKISLEEVAVNLKHRDNIDTTREVSPLKKAEDAVFLDNSKMSREEQLDFVLDLVKERM
ncbi:MAG TPA: (d)CMP kinase [Sphingobacterium sp.]|nr:(d)CMP kinase [Sphingobacterium sp.]